MKLEKLMLIGMKIVELLVLAFLVWGALQLTPRMWLIALFVLTLGLIGYLAGRLLWFLIPLWWLTNKIWAESLAEWIKRKFK